MRSLDHVQGTPLVGYYSKHSLLCVLNALSAWIIPSHLLIHVALHTNREGFGACFSLDGGSHHCTKCGYDNVLQRYGLPA